MPLPTNDIANRETLRFALVGIAKFRTYLAGAERRYQPPRHADIGDDPTNPDLNIAWKYLVTSKDTWLGPTLNSGRIGAIYNLTMDPFEKYDMTFNGAVAEGVGFEPTRDLATPGGFQDRCLKPLGHPSNSTRSDT